MAAYKRLTNDVYVHGSVSLALAMAQETGMIKVLCQAEGPLTSAHVAREAKLNERWDLASVARLLRKYNILWVCFDVFLKNLKWVSK